MRWKHLFGKGKLEESPEERAAEVDSAAIVEWSRRALQSHRKLLPEDFNAIFADQAAWFAIPTFVALKQKGFGPGVPKSLLDELEAGLSPILMSEAFGELTDDEALDELPPALSLLVRHFIVLWLASFEAFPSRKYFNDPVLLEKMLAALFRNPDHGLAETLYLTDEETLQSFAGAIARMIFECYQDVDKLD